MTPNETVDTEARAREGHREEKEHLACRMIKTCMPRGIFYYDGDN